MPAPTGGRSGLRRGGRPPPSWLPRRPFPGAPPPTRLSEDCFSPSACAPLSAAGPVAWCVPRAEIKDLLCCVIPGSGSALAYLEPTWALAGGVGCCALPCTGRPRPAREGPGRSALGQSGGTRPTPLGVAGPAAEGARPASSGSLAAPRRGGDEELSEPPSWATGTFPGQCRGAGGGEPTGPPQATLLDSRPALTRPSCLPLPSPGPRAVASGTATPTPRDVPDGVTAAGFGANFTPRTQGQ